MRAGYGRWELTPPLGVELAGYGYYLGRCAQSVRDPLYARAVMLEEGETRSLIISCDLLGLSKGVCSEVFAHAQKYDVSADHVVIVSIHTHTGPCIKYHEGCGFVNDEYVSAAGDLICRAVDEAVGDMDDVTQIRQVCSPFEGDHIYNRTVEGGPDKPAARVALIWEKEMLEKLDTLRDTEDIICKYILLGGVPILALPFEGFTRIGQEVRSIIRREDCLVLGCAEELLGYLPTRDDIARGAYAALESTFLYKRLPVVPGEAERLGDEMGRALERVLA